MCTVQRNLKFNQEILKISYIIKICKNLKPIKII